MISKITVSQVIEEWMQRGGFFLVDLKVSNDNTISIEIEKEKGSVDIDDCVDLSKFIESKLDREVEDYSLEVASAGIGQAFKVRQQYDKYIGQEVEVSLKNGKRFVGVLKEVNEDGFCVNVLRKIKPEGSKRSVMTPMDETYSYAEANSVKYKLNF